MNNEKDINKTIGKAFIYDFTQLDKETQIYIYGAINIELLKSKK